jgi:putative AlgH/UPF0301 family transcriptional regulator
MIKTVQWGLPLNKQSALIAQDFMNQLPGEDPIFYGGPVEGDALFYLHTLDTLNGAMPAGNGPISRGRLHGVTRRH